MYPPHTCLNVFTKALTLITKIELHTNEELSENMRVNEGVNSLLNFISVNKNIFSNYHFAIALFIINIISAHHMTPMSRFPLLGTLSSHLVPGVFLRIYDCVTRVFVLCGKYSTPPPLACSTGCEFQEFILYPQL